MWKAEDTMRRDNTKERVGRYISHSQAQTWLNCEQKWWYNYKLGWVSKDTVPHLVMGDYIHGKLDIYYQMQKYEDGEPHYTPDELYDIMEPLILEDLKEDGTNGEHISRALKTMNRYIRVYAPVEDEGMEVVESEMYFEIEIPTPKDRTVTIEGYVDLFYKNKFGLLIVRDHKSTDSGRFWNSLQVNYDMQQTVYIAGLRSLGYDVWRGEVNFLNTHDYKDFNAVPIEKMFKTVGASRTQDELDASLLWLGKMVDRQLDLTDPQMSRDKSCGYCPYANPCLHKFKGKDDAVILQLGFRRKDGYTEYHAAEANQQSSSDVS